KCRALRGASIADHPGIAVKCREKSSLVWIFRAGRRACKPAKALLCRCLILELKNVLAVRSHAHPHAAFAHRDIAVTNLCLADSQSLFLLRSEEHTSELQSP